MVDEIIELGRHEVTVASVMSRLVRHQDKIKKITAIVEWNDGTVDVVRSPKTAPDMAYDLLVLQKSALGMFENLESGPVDLI